MKSLALNLIKQLPKNHEGRNSFLLNYGDCEESKRIKVEYILRNSGTTPDEKVKLIEDVYLSKVVTEGQETYTPQPQYSQQQPRW